MPSSARADRGKSGLIARGHAWRGEGAAVLQVNVVTVLQSCGEVRVGSLPVSLSDLLHSRWVWMRKSAHFLEEMLEASRADELNDDDRLVGGIPQGMYEAARLEEEAAFVHLCLVLSNQAADSPPVDKCVLVFVFVAVRYNQLPRCEHC